MKKIFLLIAITALLLSTSFKTFAQSDEHETISYPVPKWVSDMGYWVVETNLHTPDKNIVYFYNNDHVMVYKENVNGIIIKHTRRKVKMHLKKALEQAVTAYNEKKLADENQMLVMNRMKKHK